MIRPWLVAFMAVAAPLSACTSNKTPLVAKCFSLSAWKKQTRPGQALVGVPYGVQTTPIPLDSVQFSDSRVARDVSIQQLSASRTATGTVQVSARFVACSSDPTTVRMRTNFIADGQVPAEPVSAWKTVHLDPRLLATYSELSTSRTVANYIIEIAGP
jgi:hypothetical protein